MCLLLLVARLLKVLIFASPNTRTHTSPHPISPPHHHPLQVKVLSGGEKARLALAKFMCTKVRQD